jgi:SAM-dependent methyltransferase
VTATGATAVRQHAYGAHGLTLVDRFGIWLSERAVRRHLRGARDVVLADLGCGHDARLLTALGPRLREGLGIDVTIGEEARAVPGLRFVEGRLEDVLPTLPDGRYDVVLLLSVLEHLASPGPALEHCHRILGSDGVLLANVPTWRGKALLELSAFRLGTSPAAEMDDHKMYYDKRDLWPLLVRAGFRPSRIRLRYHKFGLNLFAVARA